jgi:trk system potassium uptake protein TrkH
VLAVTGVLLVGGAILFALFEWHQTLGGMSTWDRLVNSVFLSVTARTAGFNAVDYAETTPGGSFLTILLMSVGGSPGSTAGGLKTTTVALIGLIAWARLRGQRHVHLWGRTVPDDTVQRAVGLFVLAFGLVTAGIFLLVATHPGTRPESFLSLMFEAVSAVNTVGLSMNQTAELTPTGRGLIIVLMFVGRLGPLSFAAALAARRHSAPFRFAHEDVALG